MSVKNKLNKIERKLEPKDEIDLSVNWRDDGLFEWKLEDGSIELITEDEFEKRGGVIVSWPDDESE